MKTDIEIAQEAKMLPIKDVAAAIGIDEDDLELYGKYKAKISDELIQKSRNDLEICLSFLAEVFTFIKIMNISTGIFGSLKILFIWT